MTVGTAPPRTRWLQGLREVADAFDAWVVDQFGVLHDGRRAYPGAADALRRLVARGDPVIVLSNSGKRDAVNEARLAARGFGPDTHTALLTSGELTHRMLAQRGDRFFASLGPRCRLIANDADRSLVDGLPVETVEHAGAADFVLIGGVGDQHDPHAFDAEFGAAIARGVPALCANPDLSRLDHAEIVPSSGALAQRYEALGGTVRRIGKPHPEVYAWCSEQLRRAGRHRIAMVGDSLAHDLAGAQQAGWRTVLVAGGVHRDALLVAGDREAALQRALAAHGLGTPPDAVLDRLAW